MDILDWPLLEQLDCIWIEDEDPAKVANSSSFSSAYSKRHYGEGGIVPTFAPNNRGTGEGSSPLMHYRGADVRAALEGLVIEEGDAYEAIQIKFTNPIDGNPVFSTLGYNAQLLRPNEKTLPCRQTASTLYCCIDGHGYTEVGGQRLEWRKNDIFLVPNHLWRHHVNLEKSTNAILYSVTDAPLLKKIGHFRSQGQTQAGDIVTLNG